MLRNIVRRIIPLLRRHVFLILAAFVLLAVFAILWLPLAYTPLGTIRVWTYVALRMRPFSTAVKDVGSSSLLVNTEGAFYPPRMESARSGPAGGSSGTCYPAIPLQLPGASASSHPCITKSDEEPQCSDSVG
jgi:hypothetical protein